MFGRINRYLIKTAMVPFSISLLIAALLLLLEQMLRLLDFVLHENGPVEVVWRMLAFLVPHYLGLALPLSLFIGLAIAYRRLSLSSEYDAMRATGLSGWRLLRPMLGFAALMMVLNFLLLAYVQPYARYSYHELRYELQTGLLGARFPVGDFIAISDDVRMRIGETTENGARLGDVFVVYRPESGQRSAFTATHGQFLKASSANALILRLYDGVQMVQRSLEDQPGVLRFEQQDITIPLPEVATFRDRGGEKREATINELLRILGEETPASVPDYHAFRASFHFRIIHTLTFLPIPFLALALGITSQRRPSSVGPVLGIAIVIIYHEILEEWGEGQVAAGELSPFLAMWPVFAVFCIISLLFFRLESERPGGGVMQEISVIWLGALDRIKALLPRKATP